MRNKILPALLALLGLATQSNAQIVVGITEKIADIEPGVNHGSNPLYIYNYDNSIYFSAANAASGRELWKTRGTLATTGLIKDLNPGISFSSPRDFKVMNGSLYFVATDGNGIQLWTTDGTPVNTQQVSTVDMLDGFCAYNSSLLFAGFGANGYELWTSDGTSAGTHELIDLYPGADDANPSGFTALGSRVIFGASTSATSYPPCITDGTALGTEVLAPINVYSFSSAASSYDGKVHSGFCEYNGEAYFAAEDGINGIELWKTDGTPTGTVLVKDINTGAGDAIPHGFKVYDGKLYFAVNTSDPAVDGLWVTSGTAASTVQLKSGIAMGDGDVVEYAEVGGDLYFIASNKVWVTDGTLSGTHAVMHSPDDPHRLTVLNDKLYCFATSNAAPLQFTLFNLDDLGNFTPVSMPMSNAILPGIHTDTMGNCIYFAAAPQASPNDVELYRYKDTTFSLGVNNVQAITANNIYPNPATSSFSVKNITGKNTSVYIYSLTGQLLLHSDKAENINIEKLPAGIYTVQIISDGVVSVNKLRKE